MTNDDIIEIRNQHLPSHGESFDCVAFARAIEWRIAMEIICMCDDRALNIRRTHVEGPAGAALVGMGLEAKSISDTIRRIYIDNGTRIQK